MQTLRSGMQNLRRGLQKLRTYHGEQVGGGVDFEKKGPYFLNGFWF
jgi:hypothetical protein